MDSDQLRRVMRDLGDAVNAYQQGQGFGGIEKLASEIEQLRGASYVRHARRSGMRSSERIRRHPSELILVLARASAGMRTRDGRGCSHAHGAQPRKA
jgi:hypothetical protein